MSVAVSLQTELDQFSAIWVIDTEYRASNGQTLIPVCLVAREYRSGEIRRLWIHEKGGQPDLRVVFNDNTLFVAYSCIGDMQVLSQLGWCLPTRVLDLYSEFRNIKNATGDASGYNLLSALSYFGIQGMSTIDKDEARDSIIRGGPWTPAQQDDILNYCEMDVLATSQLLTAMIDRVNLPQALLRGAYMRALSLVECYGIPLDRTTFDAICVQREGLIDHLVSKINSTYPVYDGHTFKRDRFETWLTSVNLSWPRHPSGILKLDDDTFKDMAKLHSEVHDLWSLRRSMSLLKKLSLSVGDDNRNRTYLAPFSSKTSRNQPSTSKFIFGAPSWVRGLIQPNPDHGLAYLDWNQQEFGIAAALSQDSAMMEAYCSGDPYLAFAKQAGAVPMDATKATHKIERDRFKQCVLAVQYGMTSKSLAVNLGTSEYEAEQLLQMHKRTYRDFWVWSDRVWNTALFRGWIETVFGWRLRVTADSNERSVKNFPMQANGAEMMRIAVIETIDAGIELCAPVHDGSVAQIP